ncbi:MAG: TlpA family protein disulfide reductase [Deltaproteobacteria bacterium]|nr:TlpA family protein disulfide reductase [Deltaproteobacteria bacterium]
MRRKFYAIGAVAMLTVLALAASAGAVKVGDNIPGFWLKDADGKKFGIEQYAGKKVVLISFWASWCKPCLVEMVALQALYKRHDGKDLEILSINGDTSSGLAKAKQIVARKAVTYPVLYDTNSKVQSLLNPRGFFPFNILVDKSGAIVYTHQGYNAGDEKALEDEIAKALDEG